MATARKTTPRKTVAATAVRKTAIRNAGGQMFEYETSAGNVTLPSVADLPTGLVRRNRNDQGELLFATLEWAASDEATLAVVDELTQAELAELFKMWQEDSKVSLGELLASLS